MLYQLLQSLTASEQNIFLLIYTNMFNYTLKFQYTIENDKCLLMNIRTNKYSIACTKAYISLSIQIKVAF